MHIREEVQKLQGSVVVAGEDWWYWQGWQYAMLDMNRYEPNLEECRVPFLMGYDDAMGELELKQHERLSKVCNLKNRLRSLL